MPSSNLIKINTNYFHEEIKRKEKGSRSESHRTRVRKEAESHKVSESTRHWTGRGTVVCGCLSIPPPFSNCSSPAYCLQSHRHLRYFPCSSLSRNLSSIFFPPNRSLRHSLISLLSISCCKCSSFFVTEIRYASNEAQAISLAANPNDVPGCEVACSRDTAHQRQSRFGAGSPCGYVGSGSS